MITIGYSTRKYNEDFIEELKKSCGLNNVEVIPFVNENKHPLTEVYNNILNRSTNDIIVLLHDDIYFDTKNWGNKIIKHFKRHQDYGILGVAGSTKLPKSAKWWEDPRRMRGIVNHENEGKKWESKYSDNIGNQLDPVVLVDGLFIAIHKKRIKMSFNEEIKGFHIYDVDFSIKNYLEGIKIGVMYDIRITHKSIGQTNQQWEDNREVFAENNEDILPIKLEPNLDLSSPLKIMLSGLFFKDYTGSEMYMYELAKNLTQLNCEVTIVSDIDGPLSKQVNKFGVKTLPFSDFPGYKMGDGNWMLNTPDGPQKSKLHAMYRTSNPNFDIIHIQHKPITERILQLYPDIPKVVTIHSEVISLEDPIDDDTILKFITIRPEIQEYIINHHAIEEEKTVIIYNPVDGNRFNTKNIKDENYILFVGTIDYLRKDTLFDIAEHAKTIGKNLWIVGEDKADYLPELIGMGHVIHYPPTNKVESYVKNCSETAGILLGRTTIESWMCGKPSWIYDIDYNGKINSKDIHQPPKDINKFNSIEVAKQIKEEYITALKKW